MQNCFKYMILEELFTHAQACGTRHRQGAQWLSVMGASRLWEVSFIRQYSRQKAVTKHLKGNQESDPPDSSDTRTAKSLHKDTLTIQMPTDSCSVGRADTDSLQRIWLQIRPPAKGTADNYCHPKSELTQNFLFFNFINILKNT